MYVWRISLIFIRRPDDSKISAYKQRGTKVKIGDIVSFAKHISKNKTDRIYKIFRVRPDLNWRDVVDSYFVKQKNNT